MALSPSFKLHFCLALSVNREAREEMGHDPGGLNSYPV